MAVYALTLLVLMALSMNSQSVKGNTSINPVKEVVSIYNDNFTTPYSREPYFIKVFRCTTTRCWDEAVNGDTHIYPAPGNTMSIEIVVQDINNATKFYKYTVYSHTSCKCGTITALNKSLKDNRRVHSVEINKTDYEKHFKKNPVNLRGCKSFCNTSQLRHFFTKQGYNPSFVYFNKCLPGCKATTTINKVTIRSDGGNPDIIKEFNNDIECRDYNPNPNSSGQTSNLVSPENPSTSSLTVPEYPLAIYIGSTRIFLAALLLSLILLTILTVDFTFCRRKRGFFYNLFNCKTRDNECLKCRYNETVV